MREPALGHSEEEHGLVMLRLLDEPDVNVRMISVFFGVCGATLLSSLLFYQAYPSLWLPFGLALFPFGSGTLPFVNLPQMELIPLLAFYGIVELLIAWGLRKKTNSTRITLMIICLILFFNACFSVILHFRFFLVAVAHAAIGMSFFYYMTRGEVKECFKPNPLAGGPDLETGFQDWPPRITAVGVAMVIVGSIMGRFFLPGTDIVFDIIIAGLAILVVGVFTWIWSRTVE